MELLMWVGFVRNLRLALQPRRPSGLLFRRKMIYVSKFVRDFVAASHLPLQLTIATAPALNLDRDRVACGKLSYRLGEFVSRGLAIDFENRIAGLQTGSLRLAACRDRRDHRTVKVSRGDKSGIRNRVLSLDQSHSDAAKEIIPWDFIGPGNILGEKPSEVGVGHGLGSFADAV